MRFALSYSFGKDSTLALHRLRAAGHVPVCLIATVNPEAGRSWFHGIPPQLMQASAARLGLPLLLCPTAGDDYHLALEAALARARALGATACAFGDIDIADHRAWNEARCAAAGVACLLPLWQEDRRRAVADFLAAGYTAVVKCVQAPYAALLGRVLDEALVAEAVALGADACGENGEYHTFVCGGPLFSSPIPLKNAGTVDLGTHRAADLQLG